MNHVGLMGRFVKDPTIRYTSDGKAVANFTLAVQDDYDTTKANFISCKAFGKVAENIEKFCHKGELIGVDGKISTGSYEKDGKKIYTTDVICEKLTFTPRLDLTEKVKEDTKAEAQIPEGFSKLDDDDIPF